MGAEFVIAGGSTGIGRELVRLLIPAAERIFVYSRTAGDIASDARVIHQECDFTKDEIDLSQLPEAIHGAVYCQVRLIWVPFAV